MTLQELEEKVRRIERDAGRNGGSVRSVMTMATLIVLLIAGDLGGAAWMLDRHESRPHRDAAQHRDLEVLEGKIDVKYDEVIRRLKSIEEKMDQ